MIYCNWHSGLNNAVACGHVLPILRIPVIIRNSRPRVSSISFPNVYQLASWVHRLDLQLGMPLYTNMWTARLSICVNTHEDECLGAGPSKDPRYTRSRPYRAHQLTVFNEHYRMTGMNISRKMLSYRSHAFPPLKHILWITFFKKWGRLIHLSTPRKRDSGIKKKNS